MKRYINFVVHCSTFFAIGFYTSTTDEWKVVTTQA